MLAGHGLGHLATVRAQTYMVRAFRREPDSREKVTREALFLAMLDVGGQKHPSLAVRMTDWLRA